LTLAPTIYRVDPTHLALRFAVMGAVAAGFFVGLIGALAIGSVVLQTGSSAGFFAAVTTGIAIGLSGGWLAENSLTGRWHSGRTLSVTSEGITLKDRNGNTTRIGWTQGVSVVTWYFVIRKGRAWAPKGWYCLACELKQGDSLIVVYVFVKPEIALALPQWNAFQELLSRKDSGKRAGDRPLSEIGAQAPLRYAEQDRWHFGVEMVPADFAQVISGLSQRIADWPAPNQG
jgi:hypothetical protein